ncbi:MAG: VOC family protein [Deltaproteobacteria bacterium]|nr:VOC family protein [Deltaproteobacteria bacterium]
MLTHVDRVQLVVANRSATAAAFAKLLGTELSREDRVRSLAAHRSVLRLGCSEIELLQPDGAGPAADFLAGTKGGLFAPGFATADVAALRTHLSGRGVVATEEGGQLLVPLGSVGLPGHVVVSAAVERQRVGLISTLYEATLLVSDFASTVRAVAALFALEPTAFVPIRSPEFGYEGTLTLFHPERLHRMEIITPNDAAKTMGRFFARRGASWYMCFAEADDLLPIRARLLENAPLHWTGPHGSTVDSLFIHPAALGGMMMGVSRATFAWTWSGHPARVQPGANA